MEMVQNRNTAFRATTFIGNLFLGIILFIPTFLISFTRELRNSLRLGRELRKCLKTCRKVAPIDGVRTYIYTDTNFAEKYFGVAITFVASFNLRKAIFIPESEYNSLPERTMHAMCMHELGHFRVKGALNKKLMRKIFFDRDKCTAQDCSILVVQEMAADSYAIKKGYAKELAALLTAYLDLPALNDADRAMLKIRIANLRLATA